MSKGVSAISSNGTYAVHRNCNIDQNEFGLSSY